MKNINYSRLWLLSLSLSLLLIAADPPPPQSPPVLQSKQVPGLAFPPGQTASAAQPCDPGQTAVLGQSHVAQAYAYNSLGRLPSAFAIRPGGEDDLAYSLYTLDAFGLDRPTTLSVEIAPAAISPGGEDDLPLGYWVAVSNFSDWKWDWHGPFTTQQTISLNSATNRTRYLSNLNKLSVVVFCDASASACGVEVKRIVVGTRTCTDPLYFPTAPRAPGLLSAAQTAPQAVTLNWSHTSDPHAGGTFEASSYQVYRRKVGQTNLLELGVVAAPQGQFVDPVNSLPGTPPLLTGESYEYFVRALNSAGTSALRGWSPVLIQANPPSAP